MKSFNAFFFIIMAIMMLLSACMGSQDNAAPPQAMSPPEQTEAEPTPEPMPSESVALMPAAPQSSERAVAPEEPEMAEEMTEPLEDIAVPPLLGGAGSTDVYYSVAPPEVKISRYPTMEMQDEVVAEKEFSVQVSLTEDLITPEVEISQGTTTESGQMEMTLEDLDQWELDVVLSASGFSFRDNQDTAKITLTRQGDSTPARFYLTPKAISEARQTRKVFVTFWYQGRYLAKILREVTVLQSSKVSASTTPDVQPIPTAKRAEQAATISPYDMFSAPDLTIYIYTLPASIPNAPETSLITIQSPLLQPATDTFVLNEDIPKWLASQYGGFRDASRGLKLSAGTTTRTAEAVQPSPEARKKKNIFQMEAMGRELYQKFAPPAFKNAFWTLKDRLGDQFDSIQIFTNNPMLPWELMRPTRPDGKEEQDFLGMTFRIARWHISQSATQLDSPPSELALHDFAVVAPKYEGGLTLDNVEKEVAALQEQGFRTIPGNFESVSQMFDDADSLPGIIHFAGHGSVQQAGEGMMSYAIQLEDVTLDLMTWRGISAGKMQYHPFFFMNACDIGQAHQIANFVDGWAPAVLESGASGYIGGLWPLGDASATDFSIRFYQTLTQQLQSGAVSIADVLSQTRRQFYENGDPTFLAYVFYGFPDFWLTRNEQL